MAGWVLLLLASMRSSSSKPRMAGRSLVLLSWDTAACLLAISRSLEPGLTPVMQQAPPQVPVQLLGELQVCGLANLCTMHEEAAISKQ